VKTVRKPLFDGSAAAAPGVSPPAPAPPRTATHTLRVTFHPGSAAVMHVALEPAGVPIDDVVAAAKAGLHTR
jgi:hypothetical protein